jgi:diaminopimelate decarboxylase
MSNLNQFLLRQSLGYRAGKLHVNSVDLSKVSKNVKTPFYLYNLDLVKSRLDELREAFTRPIGVHYAVKANSNRSLLKFLNKEGAGLDVVSSGEARMGIQAGFKPSSIVFSGVGKTVDEIDFAISKKIKAINVESLPELERVAKISSSRRVCAPIALRFNPDVDAKTHRHITTGSHYNKFGIDEGDMTDAVRVLKKNPKHLRLTGLTFHIGSQLLDVAPIKQALRKALNVCKSLRNQGFVLEHLSVGGGLGVPYEPNQNPVDVAAYGQMICKETKDLDLEVLLEPGRFLVAEAGVLVTEVQYVKRTPHHRFLIVDTGMNHLMRPALYEAHHEMIPIVQKSKKKKHVYEVVGPICESTDVLARSRPLSELSSGDRLAILNAGAYGFSMASQFNARPMPEEWVLYRGRLSKTKKQVTI